MSSDIEHVIADLSAAGYRITRPRRAVIEAIARARRSLDPEEVLIRAQKIRPEVGLATVYRTLDMLQAQGLLTRVQIGRRVHVMTCADDTLHFHLICQKCHGVAELEADGATAELSARMQATGFRAKSHAIEVMGLCGKCR